MTEHLKAYHNGFVNKEHSSGHTNHRKVKEIDSGNPVRTVSLRWTFNDQGVTPHIQVMEVKETFYL